MSQFYTSYYALQRYRRPLRVLTTIAGLATGWFCLSAVAQVTEALTAAKVGGEIANLPMTAAALGVAGIAVTGMIFVTKWAFNQSSSNLRVQGATSERLALVDQSLQRLGRAMEASPCIAVNPLKTKAEFSES